MTETYLTLIPVNVDLFCEYFLHAKVKNASPGKSQQTAEVCVAGSDRSA